ncbi:MAG: AMP-binding protein [Lachnospiraceae bacterium]|nr:AMP-binding protein [Lachnospiraceae bacterium]
MGITVNGSDKTLDVTVSGRLDSAAAPGLDSVLDKITSDIDTINFDFSDLAYISSVGLRKILQIKKALNPDAVIDIKGVTETVAETFRVTGFDSYVKLHTALDNSGLSIKDLFAARVKEYSGNVFVSADRPYTFNEIDRQSQVLATKLFEAGVHKGTHVGLYSFNSVNWVVAFFAVQKCGAIALPLSYSYTKEELVSLSQIGDITHICAGNAEETGDFEGFVSALTSADGSQIRSITDIRNEVSFDMDEAEYEGISGQFSDVLDPEDDCIMLFTSGSTGKPKAVLHSSYSILHSAQCAVDVMDLGSKDSVCMNVPFSHTLGLVRCFLAGLIAGARLELPSSFDIKELIAFVDERKCTVMNAVPTTVVSMANDSTFSPDKVSSIRCSILVGAPVTETQMHMLIECFANNHFISSYGMSELSPITMTEYTDTTEHICCTVGKVCDGVEVGLFDLNTGEQLDPAKGEKGEIAVRGTSAMTAYYKIDPDRQAIDKNGYIKTGDFGFFDKENYLHIGGRMKELIHTSGYTVEPNEVASVISSYDAIADVKVLGIPDDEHGELVIACITPKSGMKIDEDDLNDKISAKLDSYKLPARYLIYDRLPILSNGKVDAVSLKADAEAKVKSSK